MRTEIIRCKVCKTKFSVYAKKSRNRAINIFGRLLDPKALPKHDCKGGKNA